MVSTYRISQLAERSGVPATTLRYYESAGLLSADRTAAGYRVYDDNAVRRLDFISSAKLLGMTLEDIAQLLTTWDQGACTAVRARMRPLVARRIADVEQRIAELCAFSGHLSDVHEQLSTHAPAGACGPGCGCMPAPTRRGSTPINVTLAWPGPSDTDPGPWRREPVACTLGRDETSERARQWQSVTGRAVRREQIPNGLVLTFPGSTPALAAEIAALATAEQECCAFFMFMLQMTPTSLELTVQAPPDAQPLLAALFGATREP